MSTSYLLPELSRQTEREIARSALRRAHLRALSQKARSCRRCAWSARLNRVVRAARLPHGRLDLLVARVCRGL